MTGILQDANALGADRDPADYYGVSLMAGQKVVIEIVSTLEPTGIDAAGIIDIALLDPDGRIVATDYEAPPASRSATPPTARGFTELRSRPTATPTSPGLARRRKG